MDIKISDNWLREYVKTKASAKELGEKLALCGPSVERITKVGNDFIYDIEVTTNRVDCMSIIGIAREVYAILPDAKLVEHKIKIIKNTNKNNLLNIKIDSKLVNRVMAIVMEIGENLSTPKIIVERLENSGARSLGPVVDITNYVMFEIGHPAHVFDYDLIKDKQLIFRLSDKGEEVTTLDGKTYKLPGGDIVIDDGEGEIIDLPGIMGTKNSVVNSKTKRIVFFMNSNDQHRIRQTSMKLGIRTNAAIIEEKWVDPELATIAFARGIELYQKVCKAKIISKTYDLYPKVYRPKVIKVSHEFINRLIGIEIPTKKILEILNKLGFITTYDSKTKIYLCKVPSWRAHDVTIGEDIVEEIARIYGYYNLPSIVMEGNIPDPLTDTPFNFESKIKNILKGYGGVEIYTLSLVPKEYVARNALKLKNPLGTDTQYLRTSLKPSLTQAAKENSGEKNPFFFFEIANVYIPHKNDLPEEKMTLGIIFSDYDYRNAKGVIEALFEELNIPEKIEMEIINENKYMYIEYETAKLQSKSSPYHNYVPISKYPAQIEDITFSIAPKTKIGELIKVFEKAELVGIYKDSYTFRVWYESNEKTLTDKDVEKIRNKYLKEIKNKFGGIVKN